MKLLVPKVLEQSGFLPERLCQESVQTTLQVVITSRLSSHQASSVVLSHREWARVHNIARLQPARVPSHHLHVGVFRGNFRAHLAGKLYASFGIKMQKTTLFFLFL